MKLLTTFPIYLRITLATRGVISINKKGRPGCYTEATFFSLPPPIFPHLVQALLLLFRIAASVPFSSACW